MQVGRIFIRRCGSPHPILRGTELEFASYGVDRYKQNQYLEQNEEKRLAQIDRVIHVRIIEWVCIGFYRKEERLHLSLFHPQRLCLYDDRGQGYWSEGGFECSH